MTPEAIATIVLAFIALLGLITALFGWLFKRGADERELAVAIRDNTAATRDLAGDFRSFKDWAISTIHSHDIRLTKLEAPSHDSDSAIRDPGTPRGH